jgi:uncharacterized membrane protein (DUF2068 family)
VSHIFQIPDLTTPRSESEDNTSCIAALGLSPIGATISGHMKSSDGTILRLIALFKLLKAIALIAIGVGALKLLHRDVFLTLEHWIVRSGLDPGNRWVERGIEKASNLSHAKVRGLGIVSFIYAGLFLTEGIGLWLMKRWAEWFTIIITSSLVPVEIYELYRHPTAAKVLVLIINIAVVVYLIYRIRTRAHQSDSE